MLAMRANQAVMLWCLLAGSAVGTQVSTTQSSSRYASQVDAAAALIGRLVGPDRAAAFDLQIVEAGVHDSFALPAGLTSDGKIAIAGTSGVALASGFNWYLKYTVGREVRKNWLATSVDCAHHFILFGSFQKPKNVARRQHVTLSSPTHACTYTDNFTQLGKCADILPARRTSHAQRC